VQSFSILSPSQAAYYKQLHSQSRSK